MREEPPPADRIALLLAMGAFLFVGALRSFLAAVYHDNLVALELGPSALWSLALLSPLVFLVPTLARAPRATLVGAAAALALGRALLAPTSGTPFHLPLAALAAGAFLVLLGAALPLARATPRAAAAGIALGWALDVALLWYGDSSDPTATLRGLALLAPAGLFLVWLAAGMGEAPAPKEAPSRRRVVAGKVADRQPNSSRDDATPRQGALSAGLDARETAPRGAVVAAAVALGAWLFLQNTLAGNPYGAARWNGLAPDATAGMALVGLLVGALVASRAPTLPRAAWLALHAVALFAIVDHALLHTRLLPLLLGVLQVALVLDLALLLPRVTPRALAFTGLAALLLHFLYAFTFLFAFVPLGALWKGQAPTLYLLAALALAVPLARQAPPTAPLSPRARRAFTALIVLPAVVGGFAAATGGAVVPEPAAGDELRILSFNVHQGFSNAGVVDADVFLRVIEELDADIIVLQEADTPRFTSGNLDVGTYLAERAGYHHVYGQPTREQAFGGAILSRFPVAEWHARQLPSTSDERWYTEARLDVRGTSVWVYAIHFALPHEGRAMQADALLEQAATREGPALLVGDFNSCPSGLCPSYEKGAADEVYERATARYQDAWVAAGHARDSKDGMTYEASDPTERIDYVFASAEFTIVSAESVRTPAALAASDHLPVLVVARLG